MADEHTAESRPMGVPVPFKAIVDDIVGDDGYLTVFCANRIFPFKAFASWLQEMGYAKGDRFQCVLKDGVCLYERIPPVVIPEHKFEAMECVLNSLLPGNDNSKD